MEEKQYYDIVASNSLLSSVPSLPRLRERIVYCRRLERLWAFIEEYYSEPDLHLDDAARHCGVSRDHLNLLLHKFADMTFHCFLSRYRVEKCLAMLHEKNYTLTEVYSRCGFHSPNTFNRQFKKWLGCSPSEYKKQFVMGHLYEPERINNPAPRFLVEKY